MKSRLLVLFYQTLTFLCMLGAMVSCATAPRHATLLLDCTASPCSIVDAKPSYHVDADDPNSCRNADRNRSCTEL